MANFRFRLSGKSRSFFKVPNRTVLKVPFPIRLCMSNIFSISGMRVRKSIIASEKQKKIIKSI